jgi:hypothetical protein
MRKEVLCLLGVLLGCCWVHGQQAPYSYASGALNQMPSQPFEMLPVLTGSAGNGAGEVSPVSYGYAAPSGYYNTPFGYYGYPQGGYGPMAPAGYGMGYPAGYGSYAPAVGAIPYPPQGPAGFEQGYGPYAPPQDEHPEATDSGAVAAGGEYNPSCWLTADYLIAKLQRMPINTPLVTSGSPSDARPGALGQPNTVVLLGQKGLSWDTSSGVLVDAGVYFDPEHHFGLNLRGMYIFPQQAGGLFASDALGNPLIARPVFNVATGREGFFLTSSPGTLSGSTLVQARSQLWGFETNALHTACLTPTVKADWLVGFRLVQLNEKLTISDRLNPIRSNNITFLGAGNFVNPPNFVTDQDLFKTSNTFYGFNLGGALHWTYQWLSLNLYGKVAIGGTDERIRIAGATTLGGPGGGQTAPGGILALPSNSGSFWNCNFAVVPETGLTIAVAPWHHVRFVAGYNFLYWSSVARPGAQIDRSVNPLQVPTSGGTQAFVPGNVSGPPLFTPHDSSFILQTVNLGVEVCY